jgi:hypothetical protein
LDSIDMRKDLSCDKEDLRKVIQNMKKGNS